MTKLNAMGMLAALLTAACGGGEGEPNYTDLCVSVQIQGEGAPSCVPLINDGNESEGEAESEGEENAWTGPEGLQVRVFAAETQEGDRESASFDTTRALGEEGIVHFSTALPTPDAIKPERYTVAILGLPEGWSAASGNEMEVEVLVNEMTMHAIVIAPPACDAAISDCNENGVVDALEPGGSGNPLADVNVHVQADADGAPLVGALVTVEEYDPPGDWRTGDDGNVVVEAPASYSEVHVSVAATGFEPGGPVVVVLDLNNPAPLTFRLRPPAPEGTVEWLTGENLASVAVCECRDLSQAAVTLNGEPVEAACTSADPAVIWIAEDCTAYCGAGVGSTTIRVAVGAIAGPSYGVTVAPNALGETECTQPLP